MRFVALALFLALSGCATVKGIIFRPPTVCEKLCDHYLAPGSLALRVSATQCMCDYRDPMDESLRHLPRNSGLGNLRRSATAIITCHPDCATAAAQLK